MLPIYMVDNDGFHELISKLNLRYDMPYKDHFSRLAIPSLYEKTEGDIQKKIINEMGNFSATADLWSSCTSEPYLCLTIHYVDSAWKTEKSLLTGSLHTRGSYWRKL